VIFAVVLLAFSIAGNFKWNALLSSVARLFVYGSVAAALPALRKKQPQAERFRLPFGNLLALLALLFTGILVTRMHWGEFLVISITAALAFLNWLWARKRGDSFESTS
jgi:amino acid transporter